MSDYVTDEAVEAGQRGVEKRLAWASIHWGVEGLHPDALPHLTRAALEEAAPLIAAQALEAARGPYHCCPHCSDDLIHDVEKDGHTVPCQLCQNDEINHAAAQALEDMADELHRLDDGRTGGYYEAGRHIIRRILDRAAKLREAGR